MGLSREGHPALLFELKGISATPSRVIGQVRLRFLEGVTLELDRTSRIGDVAVIECSAPDMAETFAALAIDLLTNLGGRLASQVEVMDAFARWHDLLASRSTLPPQRELGLWGELYVLEAAPDPNAALAAWNGPGAGTIDFLRGQTGVEVKTSLHRRKHLLTWNQALFGNIDYQAFLLSLYVQDDPEGSTLPQLIQRVRRSMVDRCLLAKKLLAAGYREQHEASYTRSWSLIEVGAFPMAQIPRVDCPPRGVTNLRWTVDLSHLETNDADVPVVLAAISGATN